MNFEEEKIATLILSLKSLKGVGSKTIQKLLTDHKEKLCSSEIFSETFVRNLGYSAINRGLDNSELSWKDAQKNSARIIEFAQEHSIEILHPMMESYPKRLIILKDYPPLLFARGNVKLLNHNKIVSIIGTRKPSHFGVKMVERLSELLSDQGYVIVSGLAIGSDTAAHVGTLNRNGKTIAVLATPVDSPVYPKINQPLSDEILSNGGLLISEYIPGTLVVGRELVNNLIARDEWQAGLSDGVIVAETSLSGGSNYAIGHTIKMKKPLAVFDYSTRLTDFNVNPKFGGNIKHINDGSALSLFSRDSVDSFINRMSLYSSTIDFETKKTERSLQEKSRKLNSLFDK